MKAEDFKEFMNLELVDITKGLIGESIGFIFKNKKGELVGFRIYPKDIASCVIETYKIVSGVQK